MKNIQFKLRNNDKRINKILYKWYKADLIGNIAESMDIPFAKRIRYEIWRKMHQLTDLYDL